MTKPSICLKSALSKIKWKSLATRDKGSITSDLRKLLTVFNSLKKSFGKN